MARAEPAGSKTNRWTQRAPCVYSAKQVIRVTRLNGEKIILNADLIVRLEAVPETVVMMVNGDRIKVEEHLMEIVERAVAWKRDLRIDVVEPGLRTVERDE